MYYICISVFCHFSIQCYVCRQEFEESHSVPHCIISFHFPLASGLATLQLKSSRHPTGKIWPGSLDLCIVYPLLWLLCDGCRWLTSDHDFLREIVVIYSLNFCFCYCCSSFATALVAVGLFCCCFWFSVLFIFLLLWLLLLLFLFLFSIYIIQTHLQSVQEIFFAWGASNNATKV